MKNIINLITCRNRNRIGRLEFLGYFILWIALPAAIIFTVGFSFFYYTLNAMRMSPTLLWTALIMIGTAVGIGIVATIRAEIARLHDINLSGWWVLACLIVSWFLPIFGTLFTLFLLLWPGTDKANKYGKRVISQWAQAHA